MILFYVSTRVEILLNSFGGTPDKGYPHNTFLIKP